MGKKIYLVEEGSYSDYRVEAAFSTKEKAQEIIDAFPNMDCPGILEMDVDVFDLRQLKDKKLVFMRMKENGDTHDIKVQDVTEPFPYLSIGIDSNYSLYGDFLCDGKEHAAKILNEKRTRLKAAMPWPKSVEELKKAREFLNNDN